MWFQVGIKVLYIGGVREENKDIVEANEYYKIIKESKEKEIKLGKLVLSIRFIICIENKKLTSNDAMAVAAALKENKTLTTLRIGNNTQYIKNIQIDF